MTATLIISSGDADTGRCFRLAPELTAQIGRHRDNDIVLPDKQVSRFHATVFYDGVAWHCACFGANGMFVDGKRVEHCRIQAGSRVEFSRSGPTLNFGVADLALDDSTASQSARGSLTFLLHGVQGGDREAMTELWARCFATIVGLAKQRLGAANRRSQDEEDVASEVFTRLYFSASEGKLPELNDRQSLWRLLVSMTRNASIDQVKREKREKRGGGRVHGHSISKLTDLNIPANSPQAFDNFVGEQPTPDSIAALDELIQKSLAKLPNDEHRQMLLLKLEGYTHQEIAESLKVAPRTVERRMHRVRELLGEADE